jgi:shikimate dehydrogenase
VLGRPIAHSLSPSLHRAAYAALGLDWRYDAVDVGEPELPGFLDALGSGVGRAVADHAAQDGGLPLLDEVSDLARDVAAANTVLLRDGAGTVTTPTCPASSRRWPSAASRRSRRAVVLGSGATARSALAALAVLGCRTPVLVVRSSPDRTLEAAERLGVVPSVQSWSPTCWTAASCSSARCRPKPRTGSPRTSLTCRAAGRRLRPLADGARGGLPGGRGGRAAMLLHQAADQVRLMTGRAAPLEAMRQALPAG